LYLLSDRASRACDTLDAALQTLVDFSAEEQLKVLEDGACDLVSRDELLGRLRASVLSKRPLRVKAGFDPTRPDLHLGHAVLLAKLRQFQRFGHTVVLVVGNFTAMIGDPSGKSKTRPALTEAEVDAATATYAEQVFTLLYREQTDVVFNRDWLGRMTFADVIRLASQSTLAAVMARHDFHERFADKQPIALHELLYPLAQAQDSVCLDCDVEIGGTDQLFNLMLGRDLMKQAGQQPQVVMTLPLLEGVSGPEKMSKSLGNYVGLTESPFEQISKLMSISDERLWHYVDALGTLVEADLVRVHRADPRRAKLLFATNVAAALHSVDAATMAAIAWEFQFSRGEQPADMPEVQLGILDTRVVDALVVSGLAKSKSEARRKIDEHAVKLNGEVVLHDHPLPAGPRHVLKLGRRWARVTFDG